MQQSEKWKQGGTREWKDIVSKNIQESLAVSI